jgi:hypothetical protein
MKRSRKFLTFILILLILNTLFFVSWYAFDVQGRVKGIIEREGGKALKGKMQIESFSISDQQVFAEGINFAAADRSLAFEAGSARIQYNLLKFIFSGFKLRNLLNNVEIDRADVAFRQVPKPKKPKKKFEIPDLSKLFNNLKVTRSSFKAEAQIPLQISNPGPLFLTEELHNININITNTKVSNIKLSAVTANKGLVRINGILDRGRLAKAHAEISNYSPQLVRHPDIQDFGTELNLVLDATQAVKGENPELNAKLILWDTRALLLSEYPVAIPLLTVESDGNSVRADLSRSSVGSSSIAGLVALGGLKDEPYFDPSQLELRVDISMLGPQFSGIIDASLDAEGKASDPVLNLVAASDRLSLDKQSIQNLALTASYYSDNVDFNLADAVWENQKIDLAGTFAVKEKKLLGDLKTVPVDQSPEQMKISATAGLEVNFYSSVPEVRAEFSELTYSQKDIDLDGITGHAYLFPLVLEDSRNFYIDLALHSPEGADISVVGDIQDRNLLMEADLRSLTVANLYSPKAVENFEPVVSGTIQAFLTGSKAVLSSELDLSLNKGLKLNSGLDVVGSYDLESKDGAVVLDVPTGDLNGQPLALELIADILDNKISVRSLKFNDQLFASGNLDLGNLENTDLQLTFNDLDSETVQGYFPQLNLPEMNKVDVTARYSNNGTGFLDADISVGELKIPGLRPMSADLKLLGEARQVAITGGIDNETNRVLDLVGEANLLDGFDLRMNALTDGLDMADLMYSPLAEGSVAGNFGVYISDILHKDSEMSFDARLVSSKLSIPDVVDLDDMLLMVAQTENVLIVDTLSVMSHDLGRVNGSGALDYNLLSNKYFEGSHTLDLHVEGMLFDWLAKKVDVIKDATGRATLNCSLKTFEDQFMVQSGNLDISGGRLVLEDQPEAIREIDIKGDFLENRLILNNFSAVMGNGRLTLKNEFDEDPGTHLKLGFLDLGKLALKIDEPGALVFIPEMTTPRTLTNVVLRGQNSEFATVQGPFEDMSIKGEAVINNASVVYPPKTNNLLNLIYSFRSSLTRQDQVQKEAVPLPFTLDLMIQLQDNIKYVTYPTNFVIQPGGFLHLKYDGKKLIAANADFRSEQGSIDFFGTVFQTETLNVSIIDSQNLIDITGDFRYRSPDGTIVTLNVNTDKDTSKSIFQRLKFNLSSDNPEDVTVYSILEREARLRRESGTSKTWNEEMLREEALSLISENLNTSLLTPVLYPLENNIRRWLRLDSFSIRAGFIQNLFTEYTNDPNQLAEYTDMNQFMSDVAQFSSSILLNNLSISFSKYLGSKFFLDYKLTLQEATDLQSKTRIVVSHDTSLRWLLPQQFRLAYTFQYEPINTKLTHELMLQKSFRFWGL